MDSFNFNYSDFHGNYISVIPNPNATGTSIEDSMTLHSENLLSVDAKNELYLTAQKRDLYIAALNKNINVKAKKSWIANTQSLKWVTKTSMKLSTKSFSLSATAITIKGNVVIDGNLIITGSASPGSCPCCCLCPAGGSGSGSGGSVKADINLSKYNKNIKDTSTASKSLSKEVLTTLNNLYQDIKNGISSFMKKMLS